MHDIVLECQGVSHAFGKHKVLYDVNLKIARGEIVSLVGPSGCGKSTLLRAILGTHPPLNGRVLMNGVAVTKPGRDRGIVYQRYSLFPFLTAEGNVAFGPMLDESTIVDRLIHWSGWRQKREVHLKKAADLLQQLKLAKAVHHYPAEMSGGMCQRVAIAQALIMKPQILLLDEPFGALDEATREELQTMLLELYQENLTARREGRTPPYTILIVTHELNEAIYVSDRVIGLTQYWAWEGTGPTVAPGATIAYDCVAPVFHPDEIRDFSKFIQQREDLRRIVFNPEPRYPREAHLNFWSDVDSGKALGIMQPLDAQNPS